MILLVTVRLLDNRFHGRTANGEEREWPPSPFRLFQALVAGNARGTSFPTALAECMTWLESLDSPEVVAARSSPGQVLLTYVLNNSGNRTRTPKTFRPTLVDSDPVINYVWRFDESVYARRQAEMVIEASQHIRALGWGIDMAVGNATVLNNAGKVGHGLLRIIPSSERATGCELRVPCVGSLQSLVDCYTQYLERFATDEAIVLESTGPIYRLQAYQVGGARPHAVFKLLDENEDPARYSHAKLVHIAGMVRHVTIDAMTESGADAEFVNRFIRGKRDPSSSDGHKQMSYVPLPSIGHEHADGIIRNIMLVAPVGMERELADVAQRIDGLPLKPEGEREECKPDSPPTDAYRAELRLFTPPKGKFIDTCYLGTSRIWHSVTPVILDGHNDRKPEKTIKLIQTALQRAGIESPCTFTWQSIPFLKNCLSAHKYDHTGRQTGYHRPAHLKDRTAVHVRLTFADPIPGPVAIGAGRHCGLGLFAAIDP